MKSCSQRRLTRRDVFLRDNHTCQYCGRQTHEMTIDHVVPRHSGGGHGWENVVSACKECNHRKAGRTPEQAGMRVLNLPTRPRQSGFTLYHACPDSNWLKYLPRVHQAFTPS